VNGDPPEGRYIIGGDGIPYGPFDHPPGGKRGPDLASLTERRLRRELDQAYAHMAVDHEALERCWQLMSDLAALAANPDTDPEGIIDARGVCSGVSWLLRAAITGEADDGA
jgi:hypothetical protein